MTVAEETALPAAVESRDIPGERQLADSIYREKQQAVEKFLMLA